MNEPVRIKGVRRSQQDLRKLARALLLLVEQQSTPAPEPSSENPEVKP